LGIGSTNCGRCIAPVAFIVGIVPLVIASGAGSASHHSLGTPVFGGMILSTVLNPVPRAGHLRHDRQPARARQATAARRSNGRSHPDSEPELSTVTSS